MRVQKAELIPLVLLVMFRYAACVCKVTCTTDFISSLNCSCSGTRPVFPYRVEAECWDALDFVNGSCEIKPPLTWCQMEPEDFGDMTSIGTNCTARVKYLNGEDNEPEDYTHMKLYQHIRPLPPVNMQLEEQAGLYNLSWETAYTEDENFYLIPYLMYRVRIRETEDRLKEPRHFLLKENRRFFAVPHNYLREGTEYVADVQATVELATSLAHWSDWGPQVKWTIKSQDNKAKELYFILLLVSLPWVFLYCCRKAGWLKTCPWRYVPSPEDFFKPLYHAHQGDFKKWVGPTFTIYELDYLEKSLAVQVLNSKQTGCLEGPCEGGNEVTGESGSASCLSHSPTHSVGCISIHTVTVSGDNSRCVAGPADLYRSSPNSAAYPGGGPGEAEGPLDAGAGGMWGASWAEACTGVAPGAPSGLPAFSGSYRTEWRLVARDDEPERVSLDSFGSAERSEDGYPAVELDLDTIDSGYQEADCSSPVEAGPDGAGHSHTNYIKQTEWRLVARDDEPERVSLDSFGSAERSEDGYPAVELDLDTIDSGYQEADCSSPVEAGPDGAGHSHTNYIKQWVAFTSGVGSVGPSTD